MYISAVLGDSAMSDLYTCTWDLDMSVVRRMKWAHHWPLRSSVWLCFHAKSGLKSKPSIRSWLSGGCGFAKLLGRSSVRSSQSPWMATKSDIVLVLQHAQLTRLPCRKGVAPAPVGVTPLDCYLTDCRTVPAYDKDWDCLIAEIR